MLDAVEHDGETFVVTREGRGIARIEPAAVMTGAAVKAILRHHPTDLDWREELRGLRANARAQERAWRD